MPPKGRGRARGGRARAKGAGRGGARAKPAPRPAKQDSGAAAPPAAKRPKPNAKAAPPKCAPAAAKPSAPTAARAGTKAKPTKTAPSTPAPAAAGDRTSRIDSALKQILTSPSPASVAAAAAAAAPPDATAPSTSTASDLGKCRPWSRGDYFARVKTFKPSYWFAPPSQLSPMVCARFGWVCVGTDALACRSCDRRITYRAPASDKDEDWTAAVETFTCRLSDAHTAECPWRKEACPAGFVEFPPSDADTLFAAFTSRLRDLLQYQRDTSLLPRVQSVAHLAPDGELAELAENTGAAQNLAAVAGFPQSRAEVAHAACMLALFGWSIRLSNAQPAPGVFSPTQLGGPEGDGNGVLQCDLCGRTCGLWNFAALAPRKQDLQEDARPNKLRRVQPPPATAAPAAAAPAKAAAAKVAPVAAAAAAAEATATPQRIEMLGCYKRGRHPLLGGLEPQLVGQYRRRVKTAAGDGGASDAVVAESNTWSGHFMAEAMLWATPPTAQRVAGDSRVNKRQRQHSTGGSGSAGKLPPPPSDDDGSGTDTDGAYSHTPGDQHCFDARVEHRSFCPWVGLDGGDSTSVLHPGWRQTRTVVLMEVKRRQRGDLPFSAAAAGAHASSTAALLMGEAGGAAGAKVDGETAGDQVGLDTTSVWAALRRSLHAVR
jgi:hypothetical protein